MQQLSQNRTIHRRDVLLAASAVLLAAGCRSEENEEVTTPIAEREDVPLRIVMVGSGADAELLTRAWASVMTQPLKIQTLDISRQSAAGDLAKLPELAKKSDVLIYPILATADLFAANSIVPATPESYRAAEQELGQVQAAAKNGAGMYAGEIFAVPLGARLPALVATEEMDPLSSWAEYDRWVGDLEDAACEPLASGWAGAMFLWRAASTLETGWLFSREGMVPLVDSQPYIDVLKQMKATADRYQPGRLTPEQIWSRIQGESLRGGICFQATADNETQVHVLDLPGEVSANRVLLDPFSPVVSISSSCRQTSASKQFANWLSGGEGSETIRRQIPGMTAVRRQRVGGSAANQQQAGSYDQWLSERLETPITLPAMQLLSAAEYYAVLDQQVGSCLDGQASPDEALGEVAASWRRLNESVDTRKQERAWRRAQGMRT